jgi:hypothetical protein
MERSEMQAFGRAVMYSMPTVLKAKNGAVQAHGQDLTAN